MSSQGDLTMSSSRPKDEIQHFIIARDLLKGYVKIGEWD
jgi:hypothetical protein